jgi:hypothetical protein
MRSILVSLSILVIACIIPSTFSLKANNKELLAEVSETCKKRCVKLHPIKVPPTTCTDFRDLRPYPQVWNVCEDSYKAGAEHGCELGCEDNVVCFGLGTSSTIIKGRDRNCNQYDSVLPRPTLTNSCRTGFTKGAEAFCTDSHIWLTEHYNAQEKKLAQTQANEEAQDLARMNAALAAQAQKAENARKAKAEAKANAENQKKVQEDEQARLLEETEAAKRGKTRGMDSN